MEYDPEIMDNRRCYTCKHTYVAKEKNPCALCYGRKQKPKWEPKATDTIEKMRDLRKTLEVWEELTTGVNNLNPIRSRILADAKSIVCKGREQEYGGPEDSFSVIAKLWSDYTDHHFDAHDVAIMMSLLKIARLKANPRHRDSWVDLAGYAACGGECACHE